MMDKQVTQEAEEEARHLSRMVPILILSLMVWFMVLCIGFLVMVFA